MFEIVRDLTFQIGCVRVLYHRVGRCQRPLRDQCHSAQNWDWAFFRFNWLHGCGFSIYLYDTHFHFSMAVKYIESLVILKASEQEQGKRRWVGRSTKHHVAIAWLSIVGRKMLVLNFGVMCSGTTFFYFWWFIDLDILCCKQLIGFLCYFWVVNQF